MPKNNYIQYSSGFYGEEIASVKAVISPFVEPRAAKFQYDPTIFNRNPKKTIILNKEIDALYVDYMVNTGMFLRKFDNREQVIVQALRSFGNNFTHWYIKHAKDPKIDAVVFEFIEDTARFILTGQRVYPLETWRELIEMKSSTSRTREVSTYTSALTNLIFNDSAYPAKNRLTAEVIQLWMSQKAGIVDMLQSMNIMFGPVRWANNMA